MCVVIISFHYRDAVGDENTRVESRAELVHQVWLVLEECRHILPHDFLQLLRVFARGHIPDLWGSCVVVVDARQMVVFSVPAWDNEIE